MAHWVDILEPTTGSAFIVGRVQEARGDDFFVTQPLQISQTFVNPRLPILNPTTPTPTDTRFIASQVLNWHWSAFFKPHLWGFFFSSDWGLAWQWFFLLNLLWLASFTFCRLLGNSPSNSSNLSTIFTCSSVFIGWTYNSALLIGAALASIQFFLKTFETNTVSKKFLSSFGFVYFSLAAFFYFYPPYLVSVSLAAAAISIYLIKLKGNLWGDKNRKLNLIPAFIILGIVGLYIYEVRDLIHIQRNTIYPGQRSNENHVFSLSYLFSGNFWLQFRTFWRGQVENTAEASRNFLFSIWLVPALLIFRKEHSKNNEWLCRFVIFLALLQIFFLSLASGLMPNFFQKLLLLNHVPGYRISLVLAFTDFLLIGAFCALNIKFRFEGTKKLLFFVPSLAVLIYFATTLFQDAQGKVSVFHFVFSLAMNVLFVIAFLNFQNRFLTFFAFFSFLHLGSQIPLSRSPVEKIEKTELVRWLRSENIKSNPNDVWVYAGQYPTAHLLKMLGFKVFGSVQQYPDLNWWKKFDPRLESEIFYNRYAHLGIEFDSSLAETQYKLLSPDAFTVRVNPNEPVLKELQINLLLRNEGCEIEMEGFKKTCGPSDYVLYRRIPN